MLFFFLRWNDAVRLRHSGASLSSMRWPDAEDVCLMLFLPMYDCTPEHR
jgi:hypothetical protein